MSVRLYDDDMMMAEAGATDAVHLSLYLMSNEISVAIKFASSEAAAELLAPNIIIIAISRMG